MAGDNPTFAAANESTGVKPLNAQPTKRQSPNQHSTGDEIPASLTSLPSGFEPIVFSLDFVSRIKSNQIKSNQTVSTLPRADIFENLVKAKLRPSGPTRTEEVEVETWKAQRGAEFADVVDKVRSVVDTQQVKLYKVNTGVGKSDFYVVGLDLEGERILGVRVGGGRAQLIRRISEVIAMMI